MEYSLDLKLSEKEDSPPHPENDRCTKKVKIRNDKAEYGEAMDTEELVVNNGGDSQMEDGPDTVPEQLSTATKQTTPSFKDKLLHNDKKPKEDDDIALEEDDVIISKEGIFPSIAFSPRVHHYLEDSMKYTVVLKLLGRPIGYARLRDHLLRLWNFSSTFRLSDLEGGCFTATFFNEAEYHKVLADGPWVIAGHYLTVHPWTPEFSPINHSISQVVAWIRIPGLPYNYYKKNIIRAIGKVLGTVIRVDYNTESGQQGKFARMAIIVDLAKPLISKISVDGKALFVEYEGLPTICYHCGRYGHLFDSCPLKNPPHTSEQSPVTPQAAPPEQAARAPKADEVSESNPYGAWMQVPPSGRRYSRDPKRVSHANPLKATPSGSRFDLLRQLDTPHDSPRDYSNPIPEHIPPLQPPSTIENPSKPLLPTSSSKPVTESRKQQQTPQPKLRKIKPHMPQMILSLPPKLIKLSPRAPLLTNLDTQLSLSQTPKLQSDHLAAQTDPTQNHLAPLPKIKKTCFPNPLIGLPPLQELNSIQAFK